MARKDRIRQVSGGVVAASVPRSRPTYAERRQRQIRYNKRTKEINAQKWARARDINAQRRAEARSKWREATKAPDLTSNENLQRTLAANADRYQQTLAGIDDQERSLGIAYGLGQYGADIASNPYSRAAMLQRSYNQNQRASLNTMAARGQLYSGATQNAANTNASNYRSAYDSLSKDFGARTQALTNSRVQADQQKADAEETAFRKAKDENAKIYATSPYDAPRFPKPKKFVPKLRKFRPVLKPRRPRNSGPTGGVRP